MPQLGRRTRLLAAALLAAAGLVVADAAGPAALPAEAESAPVLAASWAPNQEGFGAARPRTVYNGGDPTGLVRKITWTGWGGKRAVGKGEACYLKPGQATYQCRTTPATIVATHLGTCRGKRAYEDVGWFFPSEGETAVGWDVRDCRYPAAAPKAKRGTPVLGGPKTIPGTSVRLIGPGTVRPAVIQLNPETSGYRKLKWSSWGGRTAVAHGTACGEGYGPCEPVTVELSSLGTCNGLRAYRDTAVVWSGHRYTEIRGCKLVSG